MRWFGDAKRPVEEYYVLIAIGVLVAVVGIVDYFIYRGWGGPNLVTALEANAEWALVALGIYLVIFELRKKSAPPGDSSNQAVSDDE
jgi:hypothetical protein